MVGKNLSRLCGSGGMKGLHPLSATKQFSTVAPISKTTQNLVIGISALLVLGSGAFLIWNKAVRGKK